MGLRIMLLIYMYRAQLFIGTKGIQFPGSLPKTTQKFETRKHFSARTIDQTIIHSPHSLMDCEDKKGKEKAIFLPT